ncbi:ArnT family glycosyltransferase [Dictyobacter arantiisoli]|uniref:Dolichyl-phosphate-mannose--protein mannosyltransferase n=1 Tax=Dictyobacter arantiisoli TaxID=2014874 RepID=A0A5A5T7F4_9CHLR|nr:glycosyltransferase family 39 protein [Dictyobacter arantiisoli]GCF07136.1 dolichyl-phosphate-mannose--protein mannosyltransferase [Dictyobacter arantiisoli]
MSESESPSVPAPGQQIPENSESPRIDIIGILTAAGAVIGLLCGLIAVSTVYSWDSPQVLGSFLVAVELTLVFLINEQFVSRPILRWKKQRQNAEVSSGLEDQKQANSVLTHWSNLALLGILFLSAFFYFCQISQNNLGNIYYAATVKSMSMSWHNFFFVSFEPGGFIAMDKPPISLWLQVVSVKIFRFSGVSLMLPLALAGIASVAVLYHLVKRAFGVPAGLIAALFLALMPVSVVASRATTMDGLLTLDILLASWALIKAAEKGSLGWLLTSAVILGLGFNIKMMEAYLVLPAFILLYLRAAPKRRRVRLAHIVLAILVIAVVSFSWSFIVDSFPASQRPYVGSSGNDTEVGLGLGNNGVERPLGAILGLLISGVSSSSSSANIIGKLYVLAGGPLRLLTTLGDQVSWLLPLAVIGLFAFIWQKREVSTEKGVHVKRLSRQQQAFIFWGAWFIIQAIFFTLDVLVQSYYLVVLAPSIAALASIGIIELWHAYRKPGWRGWLLPFGFALTALLHAFLIAPFASYNYWLTPIIVAVLLIVVILLVWFRLARPAQVFQQEPEVVAGAAPLKPGWQLPGAHIAFSGIVFASGIITILLAPTLWSVSTIQHPANGLVPVAGPARSAASDPFILLLQGVVDYAQVDPQLVNYLETHQESQHDMVATSTSLAAAPFVLQSGRNVMPLGGFNGNDEIFTVNKLKQQIASGRVRYFWLSSFFLSSTQIDQLTPRLRTVMKELEQVQANNANYQLLNWVSRNCTVVTADQWGRSKSDTGDPASGKPVLYDCATIH